MHHFRASSGLRQVKTRRTLARVAAASTAVLLTSGLIALPASAATTAPRQLYYGTDQAGTSGGNGEASSDWAGYDVTNGDYKSVSASWVQPTVSCTTGETSYSAFWVGLDGDGSESVEQIGTSSDCDNGTPTYSAWYEFYPQASQDLAATVKAGDQLTATVTASSAGTYKLVLTDKTQGWTKTETGSAPDAQNASAEIIAEAPSSARAGNVLPLANFAKVKFTDVKVNGKPLSSDATAIDMADNTGSTKASTSTLSTTASGAAFTVTWKSAGSTGQQPFGIGGGFGQGAGQGSGSSGSGGTGDGSGGSGQGGTGDGYGQGGTGGGYGQGGTGDGSGQGGTGADSGSTGLTGYPWGSGGWSDGWTDGWITVGGSGASGDGTGASSGSGWEDSGSALAQAWSDWQQQLAALAAVGRWSA